MRKEIHSDSLRVLKTATGIADPVLARLSEPSQHFLLLAEHATYDRAGVIELHAVRCVVIRRGASRLIPRRGAKEWPIKHVKIHTNSCRVLTAIGEKIIRVNKPAFAMLNLPQASHQLLQAASARRLLQAIAPPRATPANELRFAAMNAVHRLRFTLRNALVPKFAR